jgi:hypothetical protein
MGLIKLIADLKGKRLRSPGRRQHCLQSKNCSIKLFWNI